MNNTKEQLNPLVKNLDKFIHEIDAIARIYPVLIQTISKNEKNLIKTLEEIPDSKISFDKEKGEILVKDLSTIRRSTVLMKYLGAFNSSYMIVSQSLFISLVSKYDIFISGLIKCVFEIQPKLLNSINSNITFSDLLRYGDIDSAKKAIIEKEIENLLRDCHEDQIDYIGKKLDIRLKTDKTLIANFIELTERRNLCVHCNCIVSNQYLIKSKNKDVKKGDTLTISPEYFKQSFETLFELATKLTHTIMKKLCINDHEAADEIIVSKSADLLTDKKFELAQKILKYALQQKKISSMIVNNMLLINYALSFYLNKNQNEALKILSSHDWTATSEIFKLACFVIKEEYENVYSLMIKIGTKDELLTELAYRSWPLFDIIKVRNDFQDTFKSIFNNEFDSPLIND